MPYFLIALISALALALAACGDRRLQPTSPTSVSQPAVTGRALAGSLSGTYDYHEMPEIPEISTFTLVPGFGPIIGGTTVTITGNGFISGATVTFGIVPAAAVTYVDSATITAVTPPAVDTGWTDVYVQNPDGRLFALTGGFTYSSALAPGAEPIFTITDLGMLPKAIEVTAGTRITIVNDGARPHDMRSDPHPVHTDCPELNEIGVLQPGARGQSGVFLTPRTCGFHDHIEHHDDRLRGRVVVTLPPAAAPQRR